MGGRVFRKFLNPANYFLCLLIALILWNCHLSYQEFRNKNNLKSNETNTVRVLSQKKNNFGQLNYTVWKDGSVWIVETPKVMEIGREYKIRTEAQEYVFLDDKVNYDLSLGIIGKLKLKEFKEINLNCDLICISLKSLENINRFVSSLYLKSFCTDFIEVLSFIYSDNCRDIYALSKGLVLGGSGDFTNQTKQNFRNLGLTHLVAVSGFQVVLLASFVENIFLKLRLSRSARVLGAIFSIVLLVLLVGPEPPVLRSGIGIGLSILVTTFLGRKISGFRLLAYSAMILLLVNPLYLSSLSFQLSFLATLGLIMSSKDSFDVEFKWFKELFSTLLATISTFLFTLPIIVNLNGFFNPFSIFINILILPVIPLITLFNLIGLIPFLGEIFLLVSGILQGFILSMINDLGKILPNIALTKFSVIEIMIYYILLISSYLVMNNLNLSRILKIK